MNFLAHREDSRVCNTIHGALEFEPSDIIHRLESAHEVLDFIELSNVASSEGCPKVAVGCRACPPTLVRAIPDSHSQLAVTGEGNSHEIGFLRDLKLINRVSSRKSWRQALHRRGRAIVDRELADLAAHSYCILLWVSKQACQQPWLGYLYQAPTCEGTRDW